MRRNWIPFAALLAASALAPLIGPATAAEPGYWSCRGGAWIAVGEPQTAAPIKVCGVAIAIPDDQAACEQAGGRWGPAGIFPQPICRVPTGDGGRPCADDGECEGRCLAALSPAERGQVEDGGKLALLGACTAVTPVFGCMAIVEKGYVARILCAD
ncbi:MAG: hypothetical protein F9K19_15065 [Rhizobiaceae bacterium]|nr:MAG: hypothetical protein F9K19_15065 [Rhizobiaceae bacterium]CAG0995744.1 hypothetical protein RHIZO_02502 [Rhizobiaceae bacterium]